MERYVDLFLDRLFRMAERVAGKDCAEPQAERQQAPAAKQKAHTIRFSREDRIVEGELFL